MSNIIFDLVATSFNINNWSNTAQSQIDIPDTHVDVSVNNSSNIVTIQLSGNTQNSLIKIPTAQVSVGLNATSNQYTFNIRPLSGPNLLVNIPFIHYGIITSNSGRIFALSTVNGGGQIFTKSNNYQPNSGITILATVIANSNNTNYPAFVSYGNDANTPFETYIMQAQSTDGNHPADFYFLTANSSNTAQAISHQVFGNTKLLSNTSYVIAATYDGIHANVYLNGNLDKTSNVTGNLFYYGTNGLGVGSKYNFANSSLSGNVSNVEIYNYSLTPSQILTSYQNQIGNNAPTGFAALNASFPRKALISIGGTQSFSNNVILASMSRFNAIIFGAGWEGWADSGRVMHSTVANIKSTSTASNGTLVFMYVDCSGGYSPTPNTGSSVTANVADPRSTMTKEYANNNWWVYNSGSSGTIFASPVYFNWVDYAGSSNVVAYAGLNGKGETPYQYAATYGYNFRINESKTDSRFTSINNHCAANNADGLFLDNMFRRPFQNVDWQRVGSTQDGKNGGYDNLTANNLANGHAQFFNQLQIVSNNTLMNFGNFGDYGVSTTANQGALNNIMHGGLLEEFIGLNNSLDTFSTYSVMQAAYANAIALCRAPAYVVLHGYWPDTGTQTVPVNTEHMWARYIIGSSCMQNGLGAVSRLSQGYTADSLSDIGWYDEWDYNIGYPIPGVAGLPQTAANTNGLWMRQFTNGVNNFLWVVNPAGNGTKTVTTANIGGSGIWKFITGTRDSANNSGALISTSFSMLERDARLLISV